MARSLNAIAGGFGASLAGHNPPIDPMTIPLAIAGFSYPTIAVGQSIASGLNARWVGDLSRKIAGLLSIGSGIYEFRG